MHHDDVGNDSFYKTFNHQGSEESYQNSGGSKTEQAGCNGMKHNASLNFFTVLYGTSQCDAVSVTNVASCRKPAGYAGNLDAGRFD